MITTRIIFILTVLILSGGLATLMASLRGPGPYPPDDFAQMASEASLVITGANRRTVRDENDLPKVPFGDYGQVYWIQVDSVLAISTGYVTDLGDPEIPEFVMVVASRYEESDEILFEWPSIFFLRPVFGDEGMRMKEQRERVLPMIEEYGIDSSHVFMLTDPVYGVFPILRYDTFDYPGRKKFPPREVWDWQLKRLQETWGLDNFGQVEAFTRKALLPFFEQVDMDWFIRESKKLAEGEPLRRVGESLVTRREYEKQHEEGTFRYRETVRVPFVAGSVLTNENLTGGFPSFLTVDPEETPGEGMETAESATEKTPVAEDSEE